MLTMITLLQPFIVDVKYDFPEEIEYSENIEWYSVINEEVTLNNLNLKDSIFVRDFWRLQFCIEDIFNRSPKSYYILKKKLFPKRNITDNNPAGSNGANNSNANNPAGSSDAATELINNAATKLSELINYLNIKLPAMSDEKEMKFLDLCAAPGGYSMYLVSKYKVSGYAISLDEGGLTYHSDFPEDKVQKIWGSKGTGNLLDYENKIDLPSKVSFVFADGAVHREAKYDHLKEQTCFKLFCAEVYQALRFLEEDGFFICKFFNLLSRPSQDLLILITHVFSTVKLIKPPHSRSINNEVYLYCNNYKRDEKVIKFLSNLLSSWKDNDLLPSQLISNRSHSKFDKELVIRVIKELTFPCLKRFYRLLQKT